MAEALQHRRGEIPKAAVGTVEVPAAFLVAGNVWGRIIEAWPSAHLIGKTATPERLAAGIQTASLSLYLQMVGRALRPAPGKNEAVILDQVGNAHRHGLPTDEREWNLDGRRRRQGVSIPIQDGPVCFCSCPSAAQVCPDCGHLFLAEERDGQRRGLQQLEGELVEVTGPARHRPRPNQQQRPRRTHPAAGCRTFEQLLEREQEHGYKSGWARHVWAARHEVYAVRQIPAHGCARRP